MRPSVAESGHFHHRQTPLVTAESVVVPAGSRLRRHLHDAVHVCAVLDGAFRERLPYGDEVLERGAIRISPACDHHIDVGALGAHCLVLQFSAGVLPTRISTLARSIVRRDADLSALVARIARSVADADPSSPLVLECHAAELAAQLSRRESSRAPTAPPRWLSEARDMLDASDAAPSLSRLAERCDVHPVHLARAFRAHFGLTLGAYDRRQRLVRAGRLLRETDLSLAQVALRLGFSDQSHMTRAFRRLLGTTPARWRRNGSDRAG